MSASFVIRVNWGIRLGVNVNSNVLYTWVEIEERNQFIGPSKLGLSKKSN